jgi:hypothetical protein
MSARPPFPLSDPAANSPRQPENTAPGATPTSVKLTDDELTLLLEFFAILDEWDRRKKIA